MTTTKDTIRPLIDMLNSPAVAKAMGPDVEKEGRLAVARRFAELPPDRYPVIPGKTLRNAFQGHDQVVVDHANKLMELRKQECVVLDSLKAHFKARLG